jgi:hypothetical protein
VIGVVMPANGIGKFGMAFPGGAGSHPGNY